MIRIKYRKANKITAISLSFFILILSTFTNIRVSAEFQSDSLIGKFVEFGTYQGKPILWRVLKVDGNGNFLLWSEYVLSAKMMSGFEKDYNYAKLNNDAFFWRGSNLRQWLNSGEKQVKWTPYPPSAQYTYLEDEKKYAYEKEQGFLAAFSKEDLEMLVPVTRNITIQASNDVEPEGGTEWYSGITSSNAVTASEALANFDKAKYITTEDRVFLLNIKELALDVEAKNIPLVKDRSAAFTDYPKGYDWQEHAPYWVETPGSASQMMVNGQGKISSTYGFLTANMVEGVCPAIVISKSKIKTLTGHGSRNSPYKLGTSNQNSNVKPTLKVQPDSWALESVNWSIENGLAKDSELGRLKNKITREDAAAFCIRLYEYLGGKPVEVPSKRIFTDTSNPEIEKAVQLAITTGEGNGKYNPKKEVSRQDFCKMLYYTLLRAKPDMDNERKQVTYSDKKEISPAALEAVEFMTTYGIIGSTTGNRFSPKDLVTVQQALFMMNRIDKTAYSLPKQDFSKDRIIKPGTTGSKVDYIISQLNQWDKEFNKSKLSIKDNFYSDKVRQAVTAFQKNNNLNASGNVDWNTWRKLQYKICWNVPHIVVQFEDPSLEKCVREALKQPSGKLYADDLTFISELTIKEDYNIKSLKGLERLIGLNKLNIKAPLVKDFSMLQSLAALTSLTMDSCNIKDTAFFTKLFKLSEVSINNCGLESVSFFSKTKTLHSLIAANNKILDISPLKDLELWHLDLQNNKITSIPEMNMLKKLLFLNVDNNNIKDIKGLKNCESLSMLSLQQNPITDFQPVKAIKTLNRIWLSNTGVSELSFLSGNKNLDYINAAHNNISSLAPLAALTKIEYMDVTDNKIKDISPLKNFINLKWLALSGNKIVDVSPLSGAAKLNYLRMDLNSTDWSALQSLPKLESLTLVRMDHTKLRAAYPSLKKLAEKSNLSMRVGFNLKNSESEWYAFPADITNKELLQDKYMAGLMDMIDRFFKSRDEILAYISKPGMTEYDKVKYVHDWVITTVTYDDDNFFRNIPNPYNSDVIGVLGSEKHLAICGGYADSVEYLLTQAGVECYTIIGTVTGATDYRGISRNEHGWNIVKIDGKYYHLDATWDDGPDNKTNLDHFLVSDDTIRSKGDRVWDISKYPSCPTNY